MTSSKTALSDMPNWPRLLSEAQAAAYLGVSINTFRARVGDRWPEPIRDGRRKLFDRLALDRAVDGLSGAVIDTAREFALD